MNTAAIEEAICVVEETNCQCTEAAAHTMYGAGTNRVINLQNIINKRNEDAKEETGYSTNDHSTNVINIITACCNGYKTGKRTIQGK